MKNKKDNQACNEGIAYIDQALAMPKFIQEQYA